jgi:hypothetical protein
VLGVAVDTKEWKLVVLAVTHTPWSGTPVVFFTVPLMAPAAGRVMCRPVDWPFTDVADVNVEVSPEKRAAKYGDFEHVIDVVRTLTGAVWASTT